MNYKEIQQRLNSWSDKPITKGRAVLAQQSKFSADFMGRLYNLLCEDPYLSWTDAVEELGYSERNRDKKGHSQGLKLNYHKLNRWYENRGWKPVPERRSKVEDNLDYIISELKKGVSYKKVAETIGLSESGIYYWLARHGYQTNYKGKNRKRKVTLVEKHHDEVMALRNKGYDVKQIREETGISNGTITRILKKYGTTKPNKQTIHKEEVMELYNQGLSQKKISKKVGISRGTVSTIITKYKQTK